MANLKKDRRYITINEAAEICNVARRTIYNWIQAGYISEIMRTPSGMPRLDKTVLLSNKHIHRRIKQKENFGLQ